MYSAQNGHEQVCTCSLQHLNHFAAVQTLQYHVQVARFLLENGATVDATEEDGYTALMFCCENGHEQCVNALVEAKANIHAKNKDKDTALDIARREGHAVVCQLLEKEDPT